jgi:excisionase family DNA binding protein
MIDPVAANARARLAGLVSNGADPERVKQARMALEVAKAEMVIARLAHLPAQERRRLAALLIGNDREAARPRKPPKAPAERPGSTLLLTAEEVAAELQIARRRVFEMIADGTLPSLKIGSSRRIRREALKEYVEGLAG